MISASGDLQQLCLLFQPLRFYADQQSFVKTASSMQTNVMNKQRISRKETVSLF